MATKKKGLAKNKRASPAPEKYYQQTMHAYFLTACTGVDPALLRSLMTEHFDLLPVSVFMDPAAAKDLFFDPTPRSLKFITNLVVAIHARVCDAIRANDPAFVEILASMPEVRNAALRGAEDPNGQIAANFSSLCTAAGAGRKITATAATKAMNRFLKGIVEALWVCWVLSKHLPGSKTFLPFLCQAAFAPPAIIQIAKDLPPPVVHKKGAAAPAAPKAATSATTTAPKVVATNVVATPVAPVESKKATAALKRAVPDDVPEEVPDDEDPEGSEDPEEDADTDEQDD
jgi:hypothetical protein